MVVKIVQSGIFQIVMKIKLKSSLSPKHQEICWENWSMQSICHQLWGVWIMNEIACLLIFCRLFNWLSDFLARLYFVDVKKNPCRLTLKLDYFFFLHSNMSLISNLCACRRTKYQFLTRHVIEPLYVFINWVANADNGNNFS